ncbi:uncharacterized protein PHACADRAFT_263131, partial [Phanerochaete carnosa HHB-10118-sp]
MTSTAPGEIHTTSPNSLEGTFYVGQDRRGYVISITTNTTIPSFDLASAILAYDKESDLTGRTSVTGNVGGDLKISLEHNMTITGTFTAGGVDPPCGLAGSGRWYLRAEQEV